MMKLKVRFVRVLLISVMLAGFVAFSGQSTSPAQAYPDTLVDHYDDANTLTRSGVGQASATYDDSSILGGERDVVINVTAGAGDLVVNSSINFAGELAHIAGPGVIGNSIITYDGDDNAPTTLDPVGLGGVDLTTNGNNALLLNITRDDLQGTLTVNVYSDADSCSSLTLLLPGGISNIILPRSYLFFYGDFLAGCTNPADFTDVGALQFVVDSGATDSLDLVVHLFAAVSVDFGDLDEIVGNYRTQLEDQGNGEIFGAGHVISSLYLGTSVDPETNGQPNGNGDGMGDDQAGLDDENGVIRPATHWAPGSATGGHVDVTITGGDGCLYGWVDWNRNGAFTNSPTILTSVAQDRIIAQAVTTGVYNINFVVPTAVNLSLDTLNARFRLYPRDPGGSCWTGVGTTYAKFPDRFQHFGGEVEDYTWGFGPTALTLTSAKATPTIPVLVGLLAAVTLVAASGVVVFRRRRA